jgi:hypothetical protein
VSPEPTMGAWRAHEYGPRRDEVHLDVVPVSEPGAGEVRVRIQAIPLNLNDLERITGSNMLRRHPQRRRHPLLKTGDTLQGHVQFLVVGNHIASETMPGL